MIGGGKKRQRRSPARRTARGADGVDTAEVARAIVAAIARDGAIARSAVARMQKGDGQLALFDALSDAGLEIGARFVRTPLEAQLEALLRDPRAAGKDGLIDLRGLEKRLEGASSREARDTANALVERGRAKLVVREKQAFLARADARTLDPRTLERLGQAAEALVKATRFATKRRASLLAGDVERLLSPFVTSTSRANGTRSAPASSLQDVEALVDKHRELSGLTSVPKLVRLLGGASARGTLHAALLEGARAGRFELRPESGMGRLSAEDAALCIPGPQGSRLSWVRRIQEPS